MQKVLSVAAIFMAGLVMQVPASAYASFHVAGKKPPAEKPSFKLIGTTPVVQVGSGKPIPITGQGKNVPLANAIGLTLPGHWQVWTAPDYPGDHPVSWGQGDTFVNVLKGFASQTHSHFLVNWNRETLYVAPTGQKVPKKVLAGKAGTMIAASKMTARPGPVSEHKPPAPAPKKVAASAAKTQAKAAKAGASVAKAEPMRPRPVFCLRPGALAPQIEVWADGAGAPLQWKAPKVVVHGSKCFDTNNINKAIAAAFKWLRTSPAHADLSMRRSGGGSQFIVFAVTQGQGKSWQVSYGDLRPQIEAWAEKAHWDLVWNTPNRYQVESRVTLHGTFVEAASDLVKGLQASGADIGVHFYHGNKTLVINGGDQ